MLISALRRWMASLGRGKSVAVNLLGKIKTVSQLVAVPMLLYYDRIGTWFDPYRVGTWLIYVAAALTVLSMLYYLQARGSACDRRRRPRLTTPPRRQLK